MMNLSKTLTPAAVLLAAAVAMGQDDSAEFSVDEIVHRSNLVSYYQGNDGRAEVKMKITDSQGRERSRRFHILRRDQKRTDELEDRAYSGKQKFYVYFQKPADVADTVFMVHKHLDRDDDRWLYLPALDLVKRIAATDKRTSFVGSNFFYEDVSGRNIDLDRHELINTTDNYYVLKHTPKKPGLVEFDHYIMYVHKSSFIPVQTEYYDKAGKKYRVYRALKVEQIEGFPTVTRSSMENLKAGSKTVMTYSGVEYNVGLPEEIFTERYLRKPPQQYLK